MLLACLGGCSFGPNYAPVVDRHSPPERVPDYYTVRRGDTLYSIAFRYGMDFRGLASANGIGRDYQIFPGQKLRLHEAPAAPESRPATAKTASGEKPAPPGLPPSNEQSVAKNTTPKSTPASTPATEIRPQPKALDGWQWPTEGRLLKAFSGSGYVHKGIDIAGDMEQPVRAAANGTVVYAGSGLVGYGKLLIVKHSDRYLSAYAHNNHLLVKEGDSVELGQIIARMGDTGTDRTKLHFEIRRDGKPVDPVALLPKRK